MTEQKALWGWYPTGNIWVKLQVSATGQLVIDPTAIFEQPPTLGELEKGATSNWCNLHNADPDRHHARQHALNSGADHTGTITDAQHGVRTLANAHAHANLSGIGANDHHARQHALNSGADHTGTITDAQHGVRTLANAHAHANLSGIGANDHHARYTDAEAKAAAVSDAAYGAGWDGVTDVAPSKNAVYDKIQTLGADAGEGHITILPWNYNSIGQGTWVIWLTSSSILNGSIRNTPANNGDNFTVLAYLAAGTYTLRMVVVIGLMGGIVDVDINGVEVASFDLYAAADTYNTVRTQTGIVIATSGLKSITVRVDGKNASSGGYAVIIATICLWRTV